MKNIKNKLFAFLSISLVLFGAMAPSAIAEEVAVTDNGASSNNTVNVSQTQTTNVVQSNTSNITNNVTTDANTGNNTASNNTGGDTAITTGDVTTSIGVSNSGNISIADVGACDCPITNSTIISGNGANSTNTANSLSSNLTNVSVNNVVNITNNLVTNADTGNNNASFNSGNVFIGTGNIFASTVLLNGPLNISKVRVSQGRNMDRLLKIAGNGVSSINTINNVEINNVSIAVNNIANFLNNLVHNLNTGKNTAGFNNGDVAIRTGDIWSEIKVKNLANVSEVIVDCGCKPKPGEENPPILPPGITTTPPSSSVGGGGGSSPSSSAGSVAAAIGDLLPSTGGNWLFFALLGSMLMFFLGAYLRLRSGRSPGYALAI